MTLATRSDALSAPARMLRLVEARPAGPTENASEAAKKRAREAIEIFMVAVGNETMLVVDHRRRRVEGGGASLS